MRLQSSYYPQCWCVRIALCNSGGIRAALQEGNVTLEDLMTSFPFSNTFDAVTVSGKVTTDHLCTASAW